MYKGSFPCIHMNYNNKKQKTPKSTKIPFIGTFDCFSIANLLCIFSR